MTAFSVVTQEQARQDRYPYVYIESSGQWRELTPAERQYLETPFHPGDGARPYVKAHYLTRDGWGSLAGFLKRSELPEEQSGLAREVCPTDS